MFWNYNQSSSPQIDNVLMKEDLTLQELLDQENIIQELKSQNKKLTDFLMKPEVLNELVTLITTEPGDELPEQDRYKHPNIACELLTTDVPSFTQNLARDSALLSKLYSFLEMEPPLNPLLASFFSRTMGVLVVRRPEQNWYSYQFTCLQVLEFLKTKESSIPMMLKHLGTSAIMDLALKLVTQVEGIDMKQTILHFLAGQGLVENLVNLLSPSVDADLNCNAAMLICDIIIKSREAQLNCENKPEPDPILSSFESSETIKRVLEVILSGEKKESSLVGGISILLTLLDPSKPIGSGSLDSGGMAVSYGGDGGGGGASGDSSAPSPPPPVTLTTIDAILPYLPAFHDLLLNPPKKASVRLTCYSVDPPLGNTRLQVIRLLLALISTHSPIVHQQLADLNTIQLLLDLFFSYSWNNFLHTQVEKCLNAAINVDPSPSESPSDNILIQNIFVKCRLLNRILEAWKENNENQSMPGEHRKGYMGHLTRLSITINAQHDLSSLGEWLRSHVAAEELTEWQDFSNGALAAAKQRLDTCLGGKHPAQSNSDDDDERNFRNIPFQQDTQFQQLYTEYQTQEMVPKFIGNFGYHENEFNDPEDNLNPAVDRLAHLSFSVTDDDELERQQEHFQQICSQKMQSLESEDDDEDLMADSNMMASRVWNGGEGIANYNSSDDEERPGPEGREEAHMEVDQSDPWQLGGASTPPTADPTNPWGMSGTENSADNEGWANFDSNFGAGSGSALESPAACPDTVPVDVENTSTCLPSVASERRSEPLGASSTEDKDNSLEKRDDNANLSSNTGEVETLMDNFRFLSSQGLIADASDLITDKSDLSKSPPPESNLEPPDSGGYPKQEAAPETEPSELEPSPAAAPTETPPATSSPPAEEAV